MLANGRIRQFLTALVVCVLEGNLQWNTLCCRMLDYLKVSIVKFKLNFKNALESKRELI